MTTVTFNVPFESLIEAITSLDLEKKCELLEILEDLVFESEESLEQEPQVMAEIEEARKAYHKGDYLNIKDELFAKETVASLYSKVIDFQSANKA
jgi:hypothetical protein